MSTSTKDLTSKRKREEEEEEEEGEQVVSSKSSTHASTIEISTSLWAEIACFLDIPEIGKCAQVSQDLNAAVGKNIVWEQHLKKLLRKVFDGAFCIEPNELRFWNNDTPVPISKRPLKSTNFRAWYMEWQQSYKIPIHGQKYDRLWHTFHSTAGKGQYRSADRDGNTTVVDICKLAEIEGEEPCRWLIEDVPLRTYYREAGNFAYMGYLEVLQDSDDDADYYEPVYDYDGVLLVLNRHMFLPNIRLFHGLSSAPFVRRF